MNARRHALVPAAVLALAVVAAAPAHAARPDAAADRAAVAAAIARYAELTRAMADDSLGAMFRADGELLREDGAVLRGPSEVTGYLRTFSGFRVDSAAMVPDTILVMGDDADAWGTFAQVVSVPDHGTVHARGRFVIQWRRERGTWRIRRALTQSFARREP